MPSILETDLYIYKAHVVSIYDADTIRVDWDLGAGVWLRNEPIRLFGINAPEVRGVQREQGLIARDALRDLLLDKDILMKTEKDGKGKYGRYLGTIWTTQGLNVNQWLVDNGFAVLADY